MSEFTYIIEGYKDDVVACLSKIRHLNRELREFDANIGLLPDIYKAAEIIADAIDNYKQILIFGDYDCDGITATTILYKYLSYCSPFVRYYIPDRLDEGYGLNINAVKDKEIDLLITVDNGITAFEAVKYLKDKGVKVVITDHHECMDTLPEADAIVNCHRNDSKHPFKDFCGAEVACLVAMALDIRYGYGYNDFDEFLDLAAVATIADVMPLVDENRQLVQDRLPNLPYSESKGLRAIISRMFNGKTNISSEDVAFRIAPLINCASRLGQTGIAMGLLNAMDDALVADLADKLVSLNEKRKKLSAEVTKSAVKDILSGKNILFSGPAVVENSAWHRGIIGISAAKLTEMFSVPAFVGNEENGVVHGSARAYGDFNVVEALSYASEHLLTFGGHVGAGGYSYNTSHADMFKKKLSEYSEYYCSHVPYADNNTVADALLPVGFCTYENVQAVEELGPFGEGNPKPIFVSKNVRVVESKAIGKDSCTFKLAVADNKGHVLNCIGFHMGYYADIIHLNDVVDVVYTLGFNEFNGRVSVQAGILDIQNTAIKIKAEEIYNNETSVFVEDERIKNISKALILFTQKFCVSAASVPFNVLNCWVNSVLKLIVSKQELYTVLRIIKETHFINVVINPENNCVICKKEDNEPTTRITQTEEYLKIRK